MNNTPRKTETERALKLYAIERQLTRALADARRDGRKDDEQLILARLAELTLN
jgi:hypothetical protein